MKRAKQQLKKIGLVVAMAGFSANLLAAQANGTAAANVVAPIAISQTTGMDFGDVSVDTGGGTVVLATTGARSVTGDAFAHTTATGAAGTFQVTGNGVAAFSISISASATLENAGGQQMTVDTFVHDAGVSPALFAGSATFNVGATLHINGSQATGAYSTATGTGSPYTVTVNYN